MVSVDLWVEATCQWFVVISTVALTMLLITSIRKLNKTQQSFDFDQLILIAEVTKVSTRYF